MATTATGKEGVTRQPMPEQEPQVRRHNFDEVPLGFSPEAALAEAQRCLQCKKPNCVQGCPVGVDIPGFVGRIQAGDLDGAIRRIWDKNSLPAVCGRVCPQEIQCEGRCILARKGGAPVAIGSLERFTSDRARKQGSLEKAAPPPSTGKRVAVVGSGPSGLTVAGDLIAKGHAVTVYEAFHKPGGVLVYGIPEFRLPKAIVSSEVGSLVKQGVVLECNAVVGRTVSVDELFAEGYDAVYLGVGAGLPTFLGIPGDNLVGVLSANEYLTRTNLMKGYQFPAFDTPVPRGKNVAVLGAGNVAMDSARTALRLGAERVQVVYRRSREEMPARGEEIHHAEQEGVELSLLTNPVAFLGDDKGRLTGMRCVRMELGEADASGRRRPVPVADSEFELACDLVVVAVGSGANPLLTRSTPGLELNQRGYIVTEEATGKTTKQGVWAGGDIVTGAATVILAMGAGRRAADSIHNYLTLGW